MAPAAEARGLLICPWRCNWVIFIHPLITHGGSLPCFMRGPPPGKKVLPPPPLPKLAAICARDQLSGLYWYHVILTLKASSAAPSSGRYVYHKHPDCCLRRRGHSALDAHAKPIRDAETCPRKGSGSCVACWETTSPKHM